MYYAVHVVALRKPTLAEVAGRWSRNTLFGFAFSGLTLQVNVGQILQTLGGCQGGRQIYDAAKRSAQAANVAQTSQSMSGRVLRAAQALFPGVGIEQARIKTHARLPGNWYMSGGKFDAATFGKTIYINGARDFGNDSSDMTLLLHELVHVRQQILLGESDFGCKYGEGYLKGGGVMPAYLAGTNDQYYLNPMEADAYQFDSQFRSNSGAAQGARIPWLSMTPYAVDALVPFRGGVLTAFFNPANRHSAGIYHSPNGQRLTTTGVYNGQGRVEAMIPFGNGVATAFYDPTNGTMWGVYKSADGLHPGGGANTTVIYNGQARVDRMIPYGNGIIAAFYKHNTGSSWGIYKSPDGSSLTGGTASRVYSGQGRVDAMIPYHGGVLTAFYSPTSHNGWGIYYSPDGNNIGGGGRTVHVYTGSYRVESMVEHNGGVITSFFNGNSGRPAGTYWSPDGTRNITAQGSYNGNARVKAMVPLGTGVLTAFVGPYYASTWKSWGVYLSPDWQNLGGGGSTNRQNYEVPIHRMVQFGNQVFITSSIGVVLTTTGDVFGSARVYP